MPRYFFDVDDGSVSLDRNGIDLIDVDAAKVVAVSVASCLLKDDPKRFWSDRGLSLRVRCENGAILFEIALLMRLAPRCARFARGETTMIADRHDVIAALQSIEAMSARRSASDQRRGMDDVMSQSLTDPSGAR